MKRVSALMVTSLLLVMLACNLLTPTKDDSAPQIMADTFFFGHAYVDSNGDGELDAEDAPLSGALFSAAGFGARTDSRGIATIVIPGGYDGTVTASMAPPENSDYTLIGPQEVVLSMNGQVSADFLFAAPAVTPTASPATLTPEGLARRAPPGANHNDLVYCTTAGGVELKMDLYQPNQASDPAPTVIYVRGGGWTGGDKRDGIGQIFTSVLQARGYLVAAINYRLSPQYQFPAQIEDVRCAVRHLRANAGHYNLDPTRIAALGGSAGGHLVGLLGTLGDTPPWEAGRYVES